MNAHMIYHIIGHCTSTATLQYAVYTKTHTQILGFIRKVFQHINELLHSWFAGAQTPNQKAKALK